MKNDIKEKLQFELNKEIKDESQVVYILSRVRKILEIDRREKEYQILKFYCDWALHAEIENVKPVKEFLSKILAKDKDTGQAVVHLALTFNYFHVEFLKFLRENNMTSDFTKRGQKNIFNRLLSQIYADTPLIVKTVKKTRLTWKSKQTEGESHYGGRFDIEEITS